MNKSKVLLVSINKSYNHAKKCIKRRITNIDYRKTLRDMTVQYWVVSKIAPEIGIVCGIIGNVVYSAFEVNQLHSYDEEFRGKSKKVAFNCDKVREDLIGIRLPEELAFHGGNQIRSVDIDCFYEVISSQYNTGVVFESREEVLSEIEKAGLSLDNNYCERQNYPTFIDYSRKEYGYERDQKIKRKALERAGFKCELRDCDECDFCANLNENQRNRIDVHHIDELHNDPNKNDNIENLVVICNCLHRRYHYHMTKEERALTEKRFRNIRNTNQII